MESAMSMLLSSAIFLPIFLGLLTCIFGRDRYQTATKIWAVFSGLLVLGLTLFITYVFFNANSHALAQPSITIIHNNLNTNFKLVEQHLWLPQFQIKYYLGVDGISIFLLPLTALITLLISISAWKVIEQKIAYYHGFFLILCGLTIG
jgi:NADH-quinone oxidoreductase subunit M